MHRSLLAIALALVLAPVTYAQFGAAVVVPQGGPYVGVFAGPYLGYYPGAYRGFWSNGYSLYGPPVPTYGSIPGFFGGSDQRLSNYPDLNANWNNPYGSRGGYVPLNPPPMRIVVMPSSALCEIRLPAADAEVTINGTHSTGSGAVRRFESMIAHGTATTYEIEARWTDDKGIGASRRTVILRPGETVVADFTSSGG